MEVDLPDMWNADRHLSVNQDLSQRCLNRSSISRVLTVVSFRKLAGYSFQTPNLASCPLREVPKMFISFFEIAVNRLFRLRQRRVVAVMNNRSRHATKNRLNYV